MSIILDTLVSLHNTYPFHVDDHICEPTLNLSQELPVFFVTLRKYYAAFLFSA